jgi:hypothetical protein
MAGHLRDSPPHRTNQGVRADLQRARRAMRLAEETARRSERKVVMMFGILTAGCLALAAFAWSRLLQ